MLLYSLVTLKQHSLQLLGIYQCTHLTQQIQTGAGSAGGVCCLRRRGEWWTRLSLDLEHLGRPDESLEVVPPPGPTQALIVSICLTCTLLRLPGCPLNLLSVACMSWCDLCKLQPLPSRLPSRCCIQTCQPRVSQLVISAQRLSELVTKRRIMQFARVQV